MVLESDIVRECNSRQANARDLKKLSETYHDFHSDLK